MESTRTSPKLAVHSDPLPGVGGRYLWGTMLQLACLPPRCSEGNPLGLSVSPGATASTCCVVLGMRDSLTSLVFVVLLSLGFATVQGL